MTVYEDEFDLYPYVHSLLKNWKLIIFLAAVAASAALVFSLLQPRTYSATSTIVVTYSRPVLTLSEEFSTVSNNVDARNKSQAFLTIAKSDVIASIVFAEFSEQLPQDMDLVEFKEQVEVSDQGDAILIAASFEDPALSAEIANAWAAETVNAINAAYGETQPLAVLQTQIEVAEDEYHTAQAALEIFIQENQIAALERRAQESQKVLDILQSAQVGIIDLHLRSQVDIINQQAEQYLETLSEHTQVVFSKQVEEQLQLFSYYASRRTQLEFLQVQADALKGQLSSGNSSIPGDAGDALALFLSRVQAFGMVRVPNMDMIFTDANDFQEVSVTYIADYSSDSDLNLDIALADIAGLQDTPANYIADINQIIEQINVELEKTDAELQELSTLLASGGNYQYFETPDNANPLFQAGMDSLESLMMLDLPTSVTPDYTGTPLFNQIEEPSSEIQQIKGQLANEQAKQRALISERNLAETAYQALLERETEIKTVSQVSNEVALAGAAVTPTRPDARGTVTNTLLAGIVGGMLAVVWVFVSEWWKNAQVEDRAAEKPVSASE